jgi:hypothetical protein
MHIDIQMERETVRFISFTPYSIYILPEFYDKEKRKISKVDK